MSNNNQSELNIVLDLSVPSFVKNMEAQPVAVLPLNIAETIINQFIDNLSNTSFESINKNFYARLKQAYPDISPNDLKISALIKMGLSIKEMADILNISADSVKTARYRLRKKLQLNTEDNLTDFILNLQ